MPRKPLFTEDTPTDVLDSEAMRRRMLAEALMQRAASPPQHQYGRIVHDTTAGDALSMLGSAFGARRANKKAQEFESESTKRKRLALAQALGGQNEALVNTMSPDEMALARLETIKAQLKQLGPHDTPAELETFRAMTAGMPEDDVTKARRIRLGLESRSGQTRVLNVNGIPTLVGVGDDDEPFQIPLSTLQGEAGARATIAGAEREAQEGATTAAIPGQVSAKSETERRQLQIDEGYRAADSLPVINRGLELLETVETGGLAAAQLAVSNLFGVTGADEGELSANLGKAVLSQLRATFGAQFTEQEGQRLADIEAGFGKSVATNRRLLQQAQRLVERVARRGIDAARAAGSTFDAQEIERAMQFTLSDRQSQRQQMPAATPTAPQGSGNGWSIRRLD